MAARDIHIVNGSNYVTTHWSSCWKSYLISDSKECTGRCQAIIWTNAGILSIGPSDTNFSEILIKIQNCIHEKASENVVYEMVAIFFRGRWVKSPQSLTIIVCYIEGNTIGVHKDYPAASVEYQSCTRNSHKIPHNKLMRKVWGNAMKSYQCEFS